MTPSPSISVNKINYKHPRPRCQFNPLIDFTTHSHFSDYNQLGRKKATVKPYLAVGSEMIFSLTNLLRGIGEEFNFGFRIESSLFY